MNADPYFSIPSVVVTSHIFRNVSKNSSRSASVSDMSSRRTYFTHAVCVSVFVVDIPPIQHFSFTSNWYFPGGTDAVTCNTPSASSSAPESVLTDVPSNVGASDHVKTHPFVAPLMVTVDSRYGSNNNAPCRNG